MVALLLQPVADQRVAGAYDEEGNSCGDVYGVEHVALLFESANIIMLA
jgi:hypothetical protein